MGLDAPGRDPQLTAAKSAEHFLQFRIGNTGGRASAACVVTTMTDTDHYLLIGAMLTTGAYFIWLAMLGAGL